MSKGDDDKNPEGFNDLTQKHFGTGDNVARDKIVNTTVSADSVKGSVQEIIALLRCRQEETAHSALKVWESSVGLSREATQLISLTRILIDLTCGDDLEAALAKLNKIRGSCKGDFEKDLAQSIWIRIFAARKSERLASFQCPSNGEMQLTREAYFEVAASKEFLISEKENSGVDFQEPELIGLIRGLLRVRETEAALDLSNSLTDLFPSINSRIVHQACKVQSFFERDASFHYWTMNEADREEFEHLCNNSLKLIDETDGKDKRPLIWASNFLNFSNGERKEILQVCLDHIKVIENYHPEIAQLIRANQSSEYNEEDGLAFLIEKCRNNKQFRNEKVLEILQSDSISVEDSSVLLSVADRKQVRDWVEKGGEVSEENSCIRDFALIELRAHICEKAIQDRANLRKLVQGFISTHEDSIALINPFRICALCHNLIRLDLSSLASKILSKFIPEGNLWLSPLIQLYLEALLNGRQLETLHETLQKIPKKHWTEHTWQLCAKQHEFLDEIAEAFVAIENALEINPLSASLWGNLVYLHRRSGSSDVKISQALAEIPDDVFHDLSEPALQLVAECFRCNRTAQAESIVVDWFLRDPDGSATFITNLQFSVLEFLSEEVQLSESVGKCLGAAHYTSDGQDEVKLIVEAPELQHTAFIDSTSPLGKSLLGSSSGDAFTIGMSEICVREILPPYVAVFRLSVKIRSALNDGSDSFQTIQVPTEPQEFIETLKRKMSYLSAHDDPLLEREDIPLFMRGFRYDASNPLRAVIAIYSSARYPKPGLPNFGSEVVDRVVLDIWSISYVFFAGLHAQLSLLPIEIVITRETKMIIERWLKDINRPDYLSLGVSEEGDLVRTTAEDIATSTDSFQQWLLKVLDDSTVEPPRWSNLPEEIAVCEEVVDSSVQSSLVLAYSNDLPLFSVDPLFSQLLIQKGGYAINAFQLCQSLSQQLDVGFSASGLYSHLEAGLPLPITENGLIKLALSEETEHEQLLVRMLDKYRSQLIEMNEGRQFIVKVATANLLRAIRVGEIQRTDGRLSQRFESGTQAIFYSCCLASSRRRDSLEAGCSVEQCLAIFLAELFVSFKDMPKVIEVIRREASRFARGHFMSVPAINDQLKEIDSNNE